MDRRQFRQYAASRLLSLYPEGEAGAIARWLCEEPLDEDGLEAALARLLEGEPLQYVLGKAWFYGREFNVSPAVLIPRQETELLVDEALKAVRRRSVSTPRVLDLCTGSGCIAWTMAAELKDAQVVAVDISDAALAVASTQGISGTTAPSFVKADVLATDTFPELGSFDVLLSNPPYVRESEKALMHRNVLEHEPELALFVSDSDPLVFYRAVASLAKRFLRPGGFGIVEINEAFEGPVRGIFENLSFSVGDTIFDLCGKPRHIFFEK